MTGDDSPPGEINTVLENLPSIADVLVVVAVGLFGVAAGLRLALTPVNSELQCSQVLATETCLSIIQSVGTLTVWAFGLGSLSLIAAVAIMYVKEGNHD